MQFVETLANGAWALFAGAVNGSNLPETPEALPLCCINDGKYWTQFELEEHEHLGGACFDVSGYGEALAAATAGNCRVLLPVEFGTTAGLQQVGEALEGPSFVFAVRRSSEANVFGGAAPSRPRELVR